jgi:hypothetical protein
MGRARTTVRRSRDRPSRRRSFPRAERYTEGITVHDAFPARVQVRPMTCQSVRGTREGP